MTHTLDAHLMEVVDTHCNNLGWIRELANSKESLTIFCNAYPTFCLQKNLWSQDTKLQFATKKSIFFGGSPCEISPKYLNIQWRQILMIDLPFGYGSSWLIELRTFGFCVFFSHDLQNYLAATPMAWTILPSDHRINRSADSNATRSVSYSTTGGFARDVTISRLSPCENAELLGCWTTWIVPIGCLIYDDNHEIMECNPINWGSTWQDLQIWLVNMSGSKKQMDRSFLALKPSRYSDKSYRHDDFRQKWMDSHVDISFFGGLLPWLRPFQRGKTIHPRASANFYCLANPIFGDIQYTTKFN